MLEDLQRHWSLQATYFFSQESSWQSLLQQEK